MWNALSRFLTLAERAFLFIANGLLLIMVAANLANILSRLMFDIGIIWVFPVTVVLFTWCVFFSFFVIYRRGQDIAVDLVVRNLPPGLAKLSRLATCLVALFLMVVICLQAPVLLPRQVGHIDLVGIQRYWLSVPLYLSALLVALEMVLRFAREIGFATVEETQEQ